MRINPLKGLPIGLKAWMDKDEMREVLERDLREWRKLATEAEVREAIYRKTLPLLNGYYWKRYPEARETLRQVLVEMKIGKGEQTLRKKKQSRKKVKGIDYLSQF
ncbi:MAG: hypothetical protein DRP00_05550 [Candidatus Aenigmatarchaeota archaeon]|nr:MAG: hypothetical protein DRP00_05550 [Candidatus Aenigmarchaeota archaeon]